MKKSKRGPGAQRSIAFRRGIVWAFAVWMGAGFTRACATESAIPQDDRIPIAEVFRLSEQLGDRIWPGWNAAPFALLLVTPEFEYLLRHPAPSPDFANIGYDELLKSEVYRRPRQFPVDLQATFPAVNNVPTIVIGEPHRTNSRDATAWVVTVMHEHFHQLQTSRPGYFEGVAKLGLAKGDKTGMWMLNFPFPYSEPKVAVDIVRLCDALRSPATTAAQYTQLRRELAAAVTPDDARYAGFQFWQEGLARYSEIRIADWAAVHYIPSSAFAARPDYRTFANQAQALHERVDKQLAQANLATEKRILFYAIGAAEGMLLDRTRPEWKSRYFTQPFDTQPYFDQQPPSSSSQAPAEVTSGSGASI